MLSKIDADADHISITDFFEMVDIGVYTPDDCSGYWATEKGQSSQNVWRDSCVPPDWATHVVLYHA